jgi:hypothetical protein
MNQKLALLIFAFAFAVAIVAGFFSPRDEKPTPSDFRAKLKENLPAIPGTSESKAEKPAESPTPVATSAARRDPASSSLREEEFLRKYNEGLKLAFDPAGRLVRIEGAHLNPADLQGSNRVPGFRPASDSELRARAEEIFADAGGLLGAASSTAFIGPTLQTGDTTGQAFYQQSIDGVPIYPGGNVSMVIGPDGELRAFDSSVFARVQVLNQAILPQPSDSRKVLYVTESQPTALLRYAYETREKGMQRINDAQTGELLLERDQKIN